MGGHNQDQPHLQNFQNQPMCPNGRNRCLQNHTYNSLGVFLDVLLIKINAKQLETNSWNRFLGISIRVPPGCGHHELQNLLHATSKQYDQPADYIIKEISFPNLKMRFYTHPKIGFRTTLTIQVTTSVHTLTVYPMNLVWVFILKFKTKIHLFPYPAHPPYFRM